MNSNFFKSILIAFVIVFASAFFFISSCFAYYDDFDSYSVDQNLSGVNNWIDSTSRPTNLESYSGNNSLKYFSTTGQNSRLTNYATENLNHEEKFYLLIGDTETGGYDFEYSMIATNTGIIFQFLVDYTAASGTVNLYHNDTVSGVLEFISAVSQNNWHEIIIGSSRTLNNIFYTINGVTFSGFSSGKPEYYDHYKVKYLFKNGPYYIDSISAYSVFTDSEVEILDTSAWEGVVEVSSQDINIDKEKICFIDSGACEIGVRYGFNHVGFTAYLFEETEWDEIDLDLTNAYDSEILTASGTLKKFLDTQPQFTPAEETVYILVLNTENEIYKIQTVNVKYFDSAEFSSDWVCDSICDDMATSTNDTFLEGMTYGIQCGFRKLTCWMMKPDSDTLMKFAEAKFAIETSFPFSVYNQVTNELQSTNIASTTGETLTMNWTIFSLPYDSEMIIASSTMMSDTWGETWETIYSMLEKTFYIALLIYFVMRILSLARKKPEENI